MISLQALFLFFHSFFSKEAQLKLLRGRIDRLDRKIVHVLAGIKKQCLLEKQGEVTTAEVEKIVNKIPRRYRRRLSDDFLWNLIADIAMEFGLKESTAKIRAKVGKFIKFVDRRVNCAIKIGRLKKLTGREVADDRREGVVIQRIVELANGVGLSTTLAGQTMNVVIAYCRKVQL